MRQSIVRIHVRVVGCQKVVVTDPCLDSKVLVVKGTDQRRRILRARNCDASPLLGESKWPKILKCSCNMIKTLKLIAESI